MILMNWKMGLVCLYLLCCILCVCSSSSSSSSRVSDVSAAPLSRARLASLAGRSFAPVHADVAALAAAPRVAGTPGAARARAHIAAALPPQFVLAQDRFVQQTIVGEREFVNLVATLATHNNSSSNNDTAASRRRVVFAAHYDSKMMPDFVGATDSAVPCAMLLDLARVMASSDLSTLSWGVQLIFFDGEEAFRDWTATDSIYGSRHLAELWAGQGSDSPNALEKISLFVLFDLVGAASNKFTSFFPQTSLQFKVGKKKREEKDFSYYYYDYYDYDYDHDYYFLPHDCKF